MSFILEVVKISFAGSTTLARAATCSGANVLFFRLVGDMKLVWLLADLDSVSLMLSVKCTSLWSTI